MAVGVEPGEAVGEKLTETIGDAEDDDFAGFPLEGVCEPLVEDAPGTFGSHRSIEVDEVPASQRSLEYIVSSPFDPVGGYPQPLLEAAADLDHGTRDLDLTAVGVGIHPLDEEGLKPVARPEIDAPRVGADPPIGFEDGAQTTCVTPIASRGVNLSAFTSRVGSLVHVEVGVELEEPFLDELAIASPASLEEGAPQPVVLGEELRRVRWRRKRCDEFHEADQYSAFV